MEKSIVANVLNYRGTFPTCCTDTSTYLNSVFAKVDCHVLLLLLFVVAVNVVVVVVVV